MAVTFNAGLVDPKDRIRQKIGDTDEAAAQIQDETILAYLAQGMSELGAARQLAFDLAAKWASVMDVSVDDQRQFASKNYERYTALGNRLKREETQVSSDTSAYPGITVGGVGDTRTAFQDRPQADYPGCVDF